MIAALAIIGLVAIGWVLIGSKPNKTLKEEERDLREYFSKRDAAERRG